MTRLIEDTGAMLAKGAGLMTRWRATGPYVEACNSWAAATGVDHARGKQQIRVGDAIQVRARAPFPSTEAVACGIPGLDRPGEELVHDVMRVADPALDFEFHGRCGFATDFDYSGD